MAARKAVVRRVVGSVAAAARDRTPPTTPTNLRVTSLSQTSFTVPQTRTTYTIDWLSPGQTYTFYVTAVDRALNQSGRSNTITVTTPRDTRPPTAPELSGTVRGPSQVSLTWTQSTDDHSFVGYRIFANGAPVTEHVNWWGERTVVLRHLVPARSYTFTVQASDSSGNTATSNAVALTTEATSDMTPPSAPTNLRILSRIRVAPRSGSAGTSPRTTPTLSPRSSTRSTSTGF